MIFFLLGCWVSSRHRKIDTLLLVSDLDVICFWFNRATSFRTQSSASCPLASRASGPVGRVGATFVRPPGSGVRARFSPLYDGMGPASFTRTVDVLSISGVRLLLELCGRRSHL